MNKRLFTLTIAAFCGAAMIGNAMASQSTATLNVSAQELTTLQKDLGLIKSPDVMTAKGSASASITSPNAFGQMVSNPSVFLSSSYVSHWSGTTSDDGNISGGFAFGNARKYVGVSVGILVDAVGVDQHFDKNGSWSLRINRYLGQSTALAIGGTMGGWGAMHNQSHGYYLAMTHGFDTKIPVTVNFGVGTGGYYSIAQSQTGSDSLKKIGAFGGVGVSLFKNSSVIADYTGQQLSLGANYIFTFFKKLPIFISVAAVNVGKHNGDNPYMQSSLGMSYSFK